MLNFVSRARHVCDLSLVIQFCFKMHPVQCYLDGMRCRDCVIANTSGMTRKNLNDDSLSCLYLFLCLDLFQVNRNAQVKLHS